MGDLQLICECDSYTCREKLPSEATEAIGARDSRNTAVILRGHEVAGDEIMEDHGDWLIVSYHETDHA